MSYITDLELLKLTKAAGLPDEVAVRLGVLLRSGGTVGPPGPTGATGPAGPGFADGDYGDITISGNVTALTVDNDVVTNAKMANMAEATIKGRASGAGTGDPTDLSGSQAAAIVSPFLTGASGIAQRASLGATPVAIANTETVITSFTLPANTTTANDSYGFFCSAGRTGNNSAAPTIRVRVGPTTLTGNVVFFNNTLSTTNPGGSWWQGFFCIHTIGASGLINSGGHTMINTSLTATAHNAGRQTDVGIDTTVANLVELTFISGNAANTYTFNTATIFKI